MMIWTEVYTNGDISTENAVINIHMKINKHDTETIEVN